MQRPESEQPVTSVNGDFAAYAVGMVYASVCTSLTDTAAADRLNTAHPDGWRIAAEPFASGDANGRACNHRPDTHRHLLFVC